VGGICEGLLTFDAVSTVIVVVVMAAVVTYVGALVAIVRPDHRNPITRPIMDWIEHHGGSER